jgi:hypothetical protein
VSDVLFCRVPDVDGRDYAEEGSDARAIEATGEESDA